MKMNIIPLMNKIQSTVSNNLVLPDPTLNHFQDLSLPLYCHGPLCKSFICYIDTLPIGQSVLIQLKSILHFSHFQSVSFTYRKFSKQSSQLICSVFMTFDDREKKTPSV